MEMGLGVTIYCEQIIQLTTVFSEAFDIFSLQYLFIDSIS